MKQTKLFLVIFMTIISIVTFTVASDAAMGYNDGSSGMMNGGSGSDDGSGMMGNGNGMMNGSTPMMNNNGTFGMSNGMAAAPIVGDDGTAYFVSTIMTSTTGTMPNFTSNIIAISPSGGGVSLTLQGIVSRPVVVDNTMVATASLPDFNNYVMMGNNGVNGNSPTAGQSVLYAIPLPLSASTKPVAISMDGSYASVPVIANNKVYVTTTDYGNAMMGGSMYGNYNLNNNNQAKTYLYIFSLDGTLISRTEIQ